MIPLSLVQLYRSLAVLLPNERSVIWGYGFSQLAEEIRRRPNEQFLIDDTRLKPVYIQLAFFLKLPPEQLQKTVDPNIKNNYYTNTVWNSYYNVGRIETKGINWQTDPSKAQILVGDELSISDQQQKEHHLTSEFQIKDKTDQIIFKGYKTHPESVNNK